MVLGIGETALPSRVVTFVCGVGGGEGAEEKAAEATSEAVYRGPSCKLLPFLLTCCCFLFHLSHVLLSLCPVLWKEDVMFIVFLHTEETTKKTKRSFLMQGLVLCISCGESFQVVVSLVALQSAPG